MKVYIIVGYWVRDYDEIMDIISVCLNVKSAEKELKDIKLKDTAYTHYDILEHEVIS